MMVRCVPHPTPPLHSGGLSFRVKYQHTELEFVLRIFLPNAKDEVIRMKAYLSPMILFEKRVCLEPELEFRQPQSFPVNW